MRRAFSSAAPSESSTRSRKAPGDLFKLLAAVADRGGEVFERVALRGERARDARLDPFEQICRLVPAARLSLRRVRERMRLALELLEEGLGVPQRRARHRIQRADLIGDARRRAIGLGDDAAEEVFEILEAFGEARFESAEALAGTRHDLLQQAVRGAQAIENAADLAAHRLMGIGEGVDRMARRIRRPCLATRPRSAPRCPRSCARRPRSSRQGGRAPIERLGRRGARALDIDLDADEALRQVLGEGRAGALDEAHELVAPFAEGGGQAVDPVTHLGVEFSRSGFRRRLRAPRRACRATALTSLVRVDRTPEISSSLPSTVVASRSICRSIAPARSTALAAELLEARIHALGHLLHPPIEAVRQPADAPVEEVQLPLDVPGQIVDLAIERLGQIGDVPAERSDLLVDRRRQAFGLRR